MEQTNQVNETANVRKLATVARILKIDAIEGSDNLELATVRGWHVVVKKGEFHTGSLCVYVEVDAVMPDGLDEPLQVAWKETHKKLSKAKTEEEKAEIKKNLEEISFKNTRPEFEFLREKKFRIKTREIFGQISQGICFPLSILPKELQWHIDELVASTLISTLSVLGEVDSPEGIDITNALGVVQYVAPENTSLDGIAIGELAQVGILVSDEERGENLVNRYEELKRYKYFKTEKLEGCLDQNTEIETEDGIKTIKEICENKYTGKIKSFDIEKNEIIFTKITGHSIKENKELKTRLINELKPKKWFEIILENDIKIILTENHEIWLPKLMCWRRADELDGNEEFLFD